MDWLVNDLLSPNQRISVPIMFPRGGGKQGFDEKELRKKEGSISFHFLDFPLLSVHRRSLSGSTT